jgi:hypothetical protein
MQWVYTYRRRRYNNTQNANLVSEPNIPDIIHATPILSRSALSHSRDRSILATRGVSLISYNVHAQSPLSHHADSSDLGKLPAWNRRIYRRSSTIIDDYPLTARFAIRRSSFAKDLAHPALPPESVLIIGPVQHIRSPPQDDRRVLRPSACTEAAIGAISILTLGSYCLNDLP